MTHLIAAYLLLLAVVVAVIIVRDARTGRCDLLSIRNVTLVGFVLFQLTSAAYSLALLDFGKMFIADPEPAGRQFATMATVLLVVGLWTYRHAPLVTRAARWVPASRAVPTHGTLLAISVVVTLLGAVLRFGVTIPLVSIVTNAVGIGMAAASAGLVGWVWGRRLLNPAMIVLGSILVLANLGLAMSGDFGRRGIVAVGGAMLWGMYFSGYRHVDQRTMMWRLALMSIGPIMFLAAYTSVRGTAHEGGALYQFRQMATAGSVQQGLGPLLNGQYAGAVSMWCIENYPEDFEYRWFMTARNFVTHPVPRAWWTEKPMPLSTLLASQAQVTGVNRSGHTLGPGIIGVAAAEGGWAALLLYALLGGMYMRFFDEILRLYPESPFVVLAIGSALGQIVGLARGSVSAFAFIAVMTIAGALVCMVLIGKLVEALGIAARFEPADDDWEDYGDAEYAGN